MPPRLATAATLVATLLLVLPSMVAAASPAPSQPAVGDPRSSGQGPGLVGDPLTAVLVVVAIAVLTIAVTMAYVRATGGDPSKPG